MNFLCIIAARMTSSRMPGKCMKEIHGIPMTEWVLRAANKSLYIDKAIIGITNEAENARIINYFKAEDVEQVDCKTDDVLTRFYQIALRYKPKNIVRITSDCPLLYFYPDVIDTTLSSHIIERNDYTWNRGNLGTCSGLDVEVFTFDTLIKTYEEATGSDREHVCPYMRNHDKFKFGETPFYDVFNGKWSVDTLEDFEKIQDMFSFLRRK